MSDVVFSCFVALGCLGGVAFVTLVTRSGWATRQLGRLGDFPVKVSIECLQAVSGLTGVWLTFVKAEAREVWLPAALASFGSFTVWKFVQLAADAYYKGEAAKYTAASHVTTQQLEAKIVRADATSAVLTQILYGIRLSVVRKFVRVQNSVLQANRPETTIVHVRKALTPTPHLNDLLDQLATVLQRGIRTVHIRVGVYVNQGGFMVPIHGVSLNNPGYNPFGSYKTRPEFYRLSDVEEGDHAARKVSHVVRCVGNHRTIVVPNCEAAFAAGDFAFANADQAKYLRSMVVYYLAEALDTDGTSTDAVIAVDADEAGFFQPQDSESLAIVLAEFGLRIRLEMALQAFLGRKGGSP